MAKRKLFPEEEEIYEKQNEKIKERIEYYQYKADYCKMMIDRGCDLEAKNLKEAKKKELSDYKGLINEDEQILKINDDILKNGIEEKDAVDEECEEEVKKYGEDD